LVARPQPPPRLAYLAWLSVCLIWGTTYLAIRIALETIPPMLIGGLRFLAAGIILCALVLVRGHRLPPPREWPRQAFLGMLLLAVGNGCVVWSERWIPSGIAAVGVAALPFWMAGAEAAFGGERLTARTLLGLATGFCGIVVLIWPSLFDAEINGRWFGLGVMLVQVACVGWAVGSSMSKRTQTSSSIVGVSALQQLFAGLMMLAVGTARGEWYNLAFTGRSAAAEVYLILFGSLVAYSAYPVRPRASRDLNGLALRVHQSDYRGAARFSYRRRAVHAARGCGSDSRLDRRHHSSWRTARRIPSDSAW
jgi:drug/metabolite transporter (DMT)-like permease